MFSHHCHSIFSCLERTVRLIPPLVPDPKLYVFRIVTVLIYLILPTSLGPGVCLASNRNEYQKAHPVRRAANLATICEPIILQYGIFNTSQPYRSPRPVTGIAFLYFYRPITSFFEINCINKSCIILRNEFKWIDVDFSSWRPTFICW
jgi:hypothetical protein